jgi:hypothetical protein
MVRGTAYSGGGAITLVYHGTEVLAHAAGNIPATVLQNASGCSNSLSPVHELQQKGHRLPPAAS